MIQHTTDLTKAIKQSGSLVDGNLAKAVSAFTHEELQSITIQVKSNWTSEEPRTPEELWECIRAFHGIEMPITTTSEDANAPFEWMWDFWKDKYPASFAIAGRGCLKCLDIATPILTANRGWVTMGEVEVGDYVYSEKGVPIAVTQTSGILYDKECYRLDFDKADSIVCDAEHLWFTYTRTNRREVFSPTVSKYKSHNRTYPSLKTTEQLFKTKHRGTARVTKGYLCKPEANHSIPTGLLEYSRKEYIHLDPYLFGLWLGDGGASLKIYSTADQELLDTFHSAGYTSKEVGPYSYYVHGLCTTLKSIGQTTHGKKWVPIEYLEGDRLQRLSLLQGLMDTDGTCAKHAQRQSFCNINENIITAVETLLTGLGIKYTKAKYIAKINDKPYWMLNFSTDEPVFRLQRKLDIQLGHIQNRKLNKSMNHHFIRDVVPIESVPVKCIVVESDTHLFLAGKHLVPTHNSFPAAILTQLKCMYRPGYEAVLAAAERKQAQVSQKYLAKFYRNPELKASFAKKPGETKAEWKNGSSWAIVTGSTSGVSGQHPAQLCLDEIEFWEVEAIEQAFSCAKSHGDYPANLQMFSTRQRSYGCSNYLTNKIESGDKNIKLYKWTIFEAMRRCPTCLCVKGGNVINQPEKTCILWEDCKGLRATKSSGIYTREEICAIKEQVSEGVWQTQYLCLRPSSHGLVLYNFGHEEISPQEMTKGNYCAWEYDPALPYFICHDPAEGQKSVCTFFQVYNGKIFVFDELVDPECFSVTKVKNDVYERIMERGYGMPMKVIVDPHRTDAGKEWMTGTLTGEGQNRKFSVEYPSMENGYNEIEIGLELLRTFISDGSGRRRFFINKAKCPQLINAIREHHYKTGKDNILNDNAAPSNAYKDEVDTFRYLVIWGTNKGYLKTGGLNKFEDLG